MTSGFEKSGTVLTVHLPAELDHPASDEIRRDSDRIIGHNYIKNMISQRPFLWTVPGSVC